MISHGDADILGDLVLVCAAEVKEQLDRVSVEEVHDPDGALPVERYPQVCLSPSTPLITFPSTDWSFSRSVECSSQRGTIMPITPFTVPKITLRICPASESGSHAKYDPYQNRFTSSTRWYVVELALFLAVTPRREKINLSMLFIYLHLLQ